MKKQKEDLYYSGNTSDYYAITNDFHNISNINMLKVLRQILIDFMDYTEQSDEEEVVIHCYNEVDKYIQLKENNYGK